MKFVDQTDKNIKKHAGTVWCMVHGPDIKIRPMKIAIQHYRMFQDLRLSKIAFSTEQFVKDPTNGTGRLRARTAHTMGMKRAGFSRRPVSTTFGQLSGQLSPKS